MTTAYIVKATINGGATYLVRAPGADPVMQGCLHSEVFTATIFMIRQDAYNEIDKLRHGIAKLCQVMEVEIKS